MTSPKEEAGRENDVIKEETKPPLQTLKAPANARFQKRKQSPWKEEATCP